MVCQVLKVKKVNQLVLQVYKDYQEKKAHQVRIGWKIKENLIINIIW